MYDTIGRTYTLHRRPDPRIAAAIDAAIGNAQTVINVGAGTGSYEPAATVVAVEPSGVMIAQRAPGAAPAVRAVAESLPFADTEFDVALAVLTIHHWTDQSRGLAELARVARHRVVMVTWDPGSPGFWLGQEYFPEMLTIDRPFFPRLDEYARPFAAVDVRPIPIPHDCADGFLGAFWRRPEAYLDPGIRSGISSFARMSDVERPLARLREDLASGEWRRRHADLLTLDELDLGYRLVIGIP